jgi:hypothetical protein
MYSAIWKWSAIWQIHLQIVHENLHFDFQIVRIQQIDLHLHNKSFCKSIYKIVLIQQIDLRFA